MINTKISWTSHTWNPVHGCSRVSEGCRNCYAERLSLQKGFTQHPWTARNASKNVTLKPHKLREPYRAKTPARIFVNSMSDLFHELIPDDYIAQVFAVMNDLPQHTFQILTKRPERAATWPGPWADHIWMGTSVEDTKALHRLDVLRECKAHVRFISFEPLIEDLGQPDLTDFHWAIVGGESGPNYRPMPHQWGRNIRDACKTYNVAYFFKQSAAYRTELGTSLKHAPGQFYTWQQFPGEMTRPKRADPHKYTCE